MKDMDSESNVWKIQISEKLNFLNGDKKIFEIMDF